MLLIFAQRESPYAFCSLPAPFIPSHGWYVVSPPSVPLHLRWLPWPCQHTFTVGGGILPLPSVPRKEIIMNMLRCLSNCPRSRSRSLNGGIRCAWMKFTRREAVGESEAIISIQVIELVPIISFRGLWTTRASLRHRLLW